MWETFFHDGSATRRGEGLYREAEGAPVNPPGGQQEGKVQSRTNHRCGHGDDDGSERTSERHDATGVTRRQREGAMGPAHGFS